MTDVTRTDVVPQEIASLLERRATLREWLGAVEERREEVRPDVFRRVRDDYRDRLESVEESLATHRSDLEASLEERAGVVADLEERREVRAADLEEVELRHAVGEYDEEDWGERKAEHEDVLSDLEERLEAERGAAEQLRDVLGELEDLGADPAAAAASAPEPSGPEPDRGSPPTPPAEPDASESEAATPDADETGSTEPEPRAPDVAGGGEPGEAETAEAPARGPAQGTTDEPSEQAEPGGEGADDALDFLENLSLEGVDFDTLDLDEEEGESSPDERSDREEERS